ncbi:MAG: right-handed parallel beta-helix repeat-containing protein, partial [Bacteroidetes bacterium CHB5]|nr:right-handed parallel beta-helix repeat-containing protein [Bacteroidetes bacterium CHB5]
LSIYTTGTVNISNSRFYQNRIGIQVYNNATPTITNSTFESSTYYGIEVDDGYATISGSSFKNNGDKGVYLLDASSIQTCSFTGNGNSGEDAGIHIDAAVVPVINANTFSGNWTDIITHPEIVDDTYFDNNGLSRIYIDNKTIAANSTWHFPASPEAWDYSLLGDVIVNPSATLTIQPGVQVNFSIYETIHVDGTLSAIGTAAASNAWAIIVVINLMRSLFQVRQ